jgi:hypothetical protein
LEAKGLRLPVQAQVVGMTGAVVGRVEDVGSLVPGMYGLWVMDAVGKIFFLRFLKG